MPEAKKSDISASSPQGLGDLAQAASQIKGGTKDIMKALAISLLSEKVGSKKISKNDPIVRQYITLDFEAAQLGSTLRSQGDLSMLRDTCNASIAKLGTITQQPQAKQLAVVYREQFTAPEKSAAELIQAKLDMTTQLQELIKLQLERVTALLKRSLQTHHSDGPGITQELESLSKNLGSITTKIRQFCQQQNATRIQLENLAKQVLGAIPAPERNAANLPDPANVSKLTT